MSRTLSRHDHPVSRQTIFRAPEKSSANGISDTLTAVINIVHGVFQNVQTIFFLLLFFWGGGGISLILKYYFIKQANSTINNKRKHPFNISVHKCTFLVKDTIILSISYFARGCSHLSCLKYFTQRSSCFVANKRTRSVSVERTWVFAKSLRELCHAWFAHLFFYLRKTSIC